MVATPARPARRQKSRPPDPGKRADRRHAGRHGRRHASHWDDHRLREVEQMVATSKALIEHSKHTLKIWGARYP